MKKDKIIRAIALFLIVFLAASTLAPSKRGLALETPEENERLHKEYLEKLQEAKDYQAALEKKKQEAEAVKKELEDTRADLISEMDELDEQLNEVTAELYELNANIDSTEEELEVTKLELEEAKKTEEDHYETMKSRIRYMYENGEESIANVLFSSESITDVLNNAEYMYRITDYDNNLLGEYIALKENVAAHEDLLEVTLDSLGTMKLLAEQEQEELNVLVRAKAEKIQEYTESIGVEEEILFNFGEEIFEQGVAIEEIMATEEARIAEWERQRKIEEERLRKEAEAAAAAAAALKASGQDVKLPSSTNGYDATAIKDVELKDEKSLSKCIWPLPGDHRTFSKFGPRKAPIKGATTYHKGWDIGGEYGAPIVSVLAGTVAFATSNSSAGNYVTVDHGNGIQTVYCHMSKILVTAGDYVLQGQILGLCGSTGVSTGPHLHFGMKSNGVYIDPDPYIGYLE